MVAAGISERRERGDKSAGERERERERERAVVHTGYDDITGCMAVASVVIQRGRFAGDPGARSK